MSSRCPYCGESVSRLARSCPACGAANPARNTVLGAAIASAVLIPAIAIAIYAATRWDRPLIEGGILADQPSASTPGEDFAWLSAAMKECDAKAAQDPNALHFLVIPLAADPKQTENWRKLALNQVGNAIVLAGDDTINGLQRRALTIATSEDYVFSIRDEKTQVVRKWEPSSGVKWFSTVEGSDIVSFRMQFKPRDKGRDDDWGNVMIHQKGNCYWINAVSFD